MERYDVVVVGVGGMGSAAAYHLARRGKRVLGLERFDVPHELGSSHGLTRIIRLGYFEHPDYVPLLRRAYELSRELEQEAREQLLYVTGIIEGGERIYEGALRSCLDHDLPHEAIDGREVARRFPAYRLPDDFPVVFQPDGGFVLPERSIVAHAAGALANGAVVRARERVLEWRRHRLRRRVRTSEARRSRAAHAHPGRTVAGGASPARGDGARGSAGAGGVPADAAGTLQARSDARLQPRARRGAL